MPKVNLGRDPVQERHEATRKLIRKAMIDRGLEHQKDVAPLVGMPVSTFNCKMRENTWTLDEMASLFSALRIPAENAALVLGAK